MMTTFESDVQVNNELRPLEQWYCDNFGGVILVRRLHVPYYEELEDTKMSQKKMGISMVRMS